MIGIMRRCVSVMLAIGVMLSTCTGPSVAYAATDQPAEYYQQILDYLEMYDVVTDGTLTGMFTGKSDYLSFVLAAVSNFVSVDKQRSLALFLEENYGYDIITPNRTGLYTASEGAGGAFQESKLNILNLRRNLQIIEDWITVIVEDGPIYPENQGSGEESNAPTDSENYYTYTLNVNLNENVWEGNDWRNYYSYNGTNYTLNKVPNSYNYERGAETLTVHVKKVVIDAVPEGYSPVLVAYPQSGNILLNVVCVSTDAHVLTYAPPPDFAAPGSIRRFTNTDGKNVLYRLGLTCTINTVNEVTYGESITSFYFTNSGATETTGGRGEGYGGTSGNWDWVYEEYEVPNPGPDPLPTPTPPSIQLPDPGEEPDAPNPGPYTPGAGSVTVDFTPIIERLDNISQQIWEFEYVFWTYRNDLFNLISQVYDMLTFYLSQMLSRMGDISDTLSAIYWYLGNVDNEIETVSVYFVPIVQPGNTVQTQLASDFSELRNKFPMSLPWDLYAMLLLLEAPPHSMIFDVPIVYFGTEQTVHVDLSGFQAFYAACRAISMWAFAWWLILKTKDLFVELGD